VDDNVRTTSRRWAAIKLVADIGECNLIANTNARGGSHSVLLRWLVNRSQRMDDAISWTHVGVSQILRFRYGAIFAIHNQSNYLIIHLIGQVDRLYRGVETRKNPSGLWNPFCVCLCVRKKNCWPRLAVFLSARWECNKLTRAGHAAAPLAPELPHKVGSIKNSNSSTPAGSIQRYTSVRASGKRVKKKERRKCSLFIFVNFSFSSFIGIYNTTCKLVWHTVWTEGSQLCCFLSFRSGWNLFILSFFCGLTPRFQGNTARRRRRK
jgi:hypothetical protein